jgi:hypothetical protein
VLRPLKYFLVFSFLLALAPTTWAVTFSNQYVSFELPNNWSCKLEGTEWLCVSQLEKQAKEAIIILTAKEVGPSDNLQTYKAHLSTPRAINDSTGKTVASQVLNVKETQINGHTWVDGMQLGSEISSYYTRYLATTKDKLALAVTFSAHKTHYTKYSQDFLKAVQSLRVIASRDLLTPRASAPSGTNERIGGATVDPIPLSDPIPLPAEPKSGGLLRYLLGLLFVVAAIGYYFYSKRK